MPTYKGHRGNLLQHWVLVELLKQLPRPGLPTLPLCFVDAHAMSPYARRSDRPGQTAPDFDSVSRQLPGRGSAYEHAWHAISQNSRIEYPSSAAFVRHTWDGPFRMVLCEADKETAKEINEWWTTTEGTSDLEVHRGDWRERFRQPFPDRVAAYVFSFDPYMFDRHGPPREPNPGNMYPSDILRVAAPLLDLGSAPVLVQLSTYSANNANRQDDVLASVAPILSAAGLRRCSRVVADGNMMSLVFSRGLDEADLDLSDRFAEWLRRATATPA